MFRRCGHGRVIEADTAGCFHRHPRAKQNMTRLRSEQVWRTALTIVGRFCETPFHALASDTDALQLLDFRSPCANYPLHDPNHRDNRDRPGREKRHRNADHAETPHDGAGALRQGASQRGEQAGLG